MTLDVEALRGDILEMQRSKYLPKWVHLDELFVVIDKWEAEQAHAVVTDAERVEMDAQEERDPSAPWNTAGMS